MFAESVHCQLSVAKGDRKVVPRTRTGYYEWSVAEVCACILIFTVFILCSLWRNTEWWWYY